MQQLIVFYGKAALALFLFWLVTQTLSGSGVWIIAIATVFLTIPILAVQQLSHVLRRSQMLVKYDRRGWFFWLLARPIITWVRNTLISLFTVIISITLALNAGLYVWVPILCGVAVFGILVCHVFVSPNIAGQLEAPFRYVDPVIWARWCALAFVAVIDIGMFWFQGPADFNFEKVCAATATSTIVTELLRLQILIAQLKSYSLGLLSDISYVGRPIAFIIVLLSQISLTWVLISMVAALTIPWREFKRVFAPPSIAVDPPVAQPKHVAWLTGSYTFFALFLWLPAVGTGETILSQMPESERPVERLLLTTAIIVKVEQIGSGYYLPGTIAKIENERKRIDVLDVPEVAEVQENLVHLINAGTDQMIKNIDPFLDEYYSLPAEYARIAAMLTGDLAEKLAEDLMEALNKGDPFGAYEESLQQILESDARIAAAYAQKNQRIDGILLAARIDPKNIPPSTVFVITEQQTGDPYLERLDLEFSKLAENIRTRLIVAGGAGATVSAATATLIVKKIIAKGTFKVAAKATAKLITSKSAGAGAGSAAGAFIGGMIGSVVPILGTASGAAAGAAVGAVVVGVSVDAVLLGLEEIISREDFKTDIDEAIEIVQVSMINEIQRIDPKPEDRPRPPVNIPGDTGFVSCGFPLAFIESENM